MPIRMFSKIAQAINSSQTPLTKEAEDELFKKYSEGDESAGTQLIQSHFRLSLILSLEYVKKGGNAEELFQEGILGLYKALSRFNPNKGARFASYATWWVRSQMQDFIRENSRQVLLPSHVIEQLTKLTHTTVAFIQKEHRDPTNKELSERLKLSNKKIDQLKTLAQPSVSFDNNIDGEGDSIDGGLHSVIEDIHQETALDYAARLNEVVRLQEMMDRRLNDQERAVLERRFGLNGHDEMTLQQTGKALGVSIARAQQVEQAALAKLQRALV